MRYNLKWRIRCCSCLGTPSMKSLQKPLWRSCLTDKCTIIWKWSLFLLCSKSYCPCLTMLAEIFCLVVFCCCLVMFCSFYLFLVLKAILAHVTIRFFFLNKPFILMRSRIFLYSKCVLFLFVFSCKYIVAQMHLMLLGVLKVNLLSIHKT